MYGKYKDASLGVKDLHTCALCFERPLFLCKEDLERHHVHYHTTNQEDDITVIKYQIEMLKNVMLNPDLVVGKRRKLSTAKSSIQDLKEQRERIQRSSRKLEHDVEELQSTSKLKSATLAHLSNDVQRLTQSVEYKSREIEYLHDEKSRIDNALLKYEQEDRRSLTREERLKAWADECASEAGCAFNSIYVHNRDYERGDRELFHVHEKFQMKGDLERVCYKVDILQAEVTSLKKGKAVREEEFLIENKHVKELQAKLDAAIAKLERKEYQLRKCADKVKVLKEELLLKEAQIKQLQKQVQQNKDKMENMEVVLAEKVKKVCSLESKISDISTEKNKCKCLIKDLELKYSKVKSQLARTHAQLIKQENCNDLEEKDLELKRIEGTCELLKADVNKGKMLVQSSHADVEQLKNEKEKRLKEIKHVNELYAEKSKEISMFKTLVENLEKEHGCVLAEKLADKEYHVKEITKYQEILNDIEKEKKDVLKIRSELLEKETELLKDADERKAKILFLENQVQLTKQQQQQEQQQQQQLQLQQQQRQHHEAEITVLREKYKLLETELSDSKESHQSCENVIQTLKGEKCAAETNAQDSKKELDQKKTELDNTKKNLALVKKSSHQDFVANQVLKKQVEDLKKKLKTSDEKEEKIVELSKKIFELQEEQNNTDVEHSNLMNRVQDGEKEIDEYQNIISELERKLADEIEQKDKMKADFDQERVAFNDIVNNLKFENENLKQGLKLKMEDASSKNESTSNLEDKEKEIEDLTKENNLKNKKVGNQTQQIEDLQNEIKKLLKADDEEKTLRAQIEVLSEKLKTKTKIVEETEAEVERSEENVTNLSN